MTKANGYSLEHLIQICLVNGVKEIKYKGVEIVFGDKPQEDIKPSKLNFPDPDINMPTDDEMLYRSTPLDMAEEETK